jgi:hypothetical protein
MTPGRIAQGFLLFVAWGQSQIIQREARGLQQSEQRPGVVPANPQVLVGKPVRPLAQSAEM